MARKHKNKERGKRARPKPKSFTSRPQGTTLEPHGGGLNRCGLILGYIALQAAVISFCGVIYWADRSLKAMFALPAPIWYSVLPSMELACCHPEEGELGEARIFSSWLGRKEDGR